MDTPTDIKWRYINYDDSFLNYCPKSTQLLVWTNIGIRITNCQNIDEFTHMDRSLNEKVIYWAFLNGIV